MAFAVAGSSVGGAAVTVTIPAGSNHVAVMSWLYEDGPAGGGDAPTVPGGATATLVASPGWNRTGVIYKVTGLSAGSATFTPPTTGGNQQCTVLVFDDASDVDNYAYGVPFTDYADANSPSMDVATGNVGDEVVMVLANPTSPIVAVAAGGSTVRAETAASAYAGTMAALSKTRTGATTTIDATTTGATDAAVVRVIAAAGGDVTAPVLSSPVDASAGPTTGTGSVTTDEGNGTLYFVVTTSATSPSAAQVAAGQDHTGSAAVDSGSQAVSGTGSQSISGGFTGLSPATTYYAHYMHADAAANQSAVSSADGFTTATISAALTGTLADGATETEIVTGGQTLIITLTNDTWVAAGATFEAQRQAIIDGLDSAQSEVAGWNAQIRDSIAVTTVVRTSDTVVTVTLPAAGSYAITSNETITVTVPAAALVTSGSAVVAGSTFTITADGAVQSPLAIIMQSIMGS